MVQCGCGKVLDKVPSWLTGVQVEFVCTNCPNRQVKSITQVSLESMPKLDSTQGSSVDDLEQPPETAN